MTKRVLGLIPARGGSKGVPRKNVRMVAGRPLIGWVAESAKKCNLISDLVVTTDDDEIAAAAEQFGALAPFRRPPELATDSALVIDAILHALDFMQEAKKEPYDYVCLVQPTAPLTLTDDYEKVIQLAIEKDADSVITVKDAGHNHPALMYILNGEAQASWFLKDEGNGRMARRQDLAPIYLRCGNVYVFSVSSMQKTKSLYGERIFAHTIPEERAVDIDSEVDMKLAEILLNERLQKA